MFSNNLQAEITLIIIQFHENSKTIAHARTQTLTCSGIISKRKSNSKHDHLKTIAQTNKTTLTCSSRIPDGTHNNNGSRPHEFRKHYPNKNTNFEMFSEHPQAKLTIIMAHVYKNSENITQLRTPTFTYDECLIAKPCALLSAVRAVRPVNAARRCAR